MNINSTLKQFGLTVKKLRIKNNISQEELAFRADLHRTYIGGIERGERNVSLINIIKISNALQIEPEKLFKNWSKNE